LVAACRLSVEKAGLPLEQSERVIEALRRHNLPLQLPADITTESIIAALRKDKKFVSGAIRFVLLRELGDAYVSEAVGENDILRAIEALR
jgi:3-dehydroquinate synthase